MQSEYRFFSFMIIVSLGLHAAIAYNLDIRPQGELKALDVPSVISEISLRYVSKKAPVVQTTPAKHVEKVKLKPVIKKTAVKPEPVKKTVKEIPAPVPEKIEPEPSPVEEVAEELPFEEPSHEPVQKVSMALPVEAEQEITETRQASLVSRDSAPVKATMSAADLEELRNTIKSNLVYPSAAKRMGWTGVVNVEISLMAGGVLKGVKIVRSSGYGALDKTVIKSINKSAPFSLKLEQTVKVNLPVRFTINGAEI